MGYARDSKVKEGITGPTTWVAKKKSAFLMMILLLPHTVSDLNKRDDH